MLKKILLFIVIFLLFYFESEKIGPITFSQVWKIPLFVFLFTKVIFLGKHKKHTFIKYSYARAVKNLFNGGVLIKYFLEVVDFIRYMMFPLMFEYVLSRIKNIKKIQLFLLQFAQFVILSGIPFVFGLLESKGRVLYDLDIFQSYTGVFQGAHSASITTAIAVLVVLSYLKSAPKINGFFIVNSVLALFGIYLLYLTFVRTGYLMFVIGLIVLFKPEKISLKQIITIFILILLLIFGFYYLLQNNELFYNRMFDIVNGEEREAGSGRLLFWQIAWDLWLSGNYFELLFGFGLEELTDEMNRKIGLKVFAHNEFFTQLAQNGLIGVIFLIGFLITLFKFIIKRKKNPTYRLALSVFLLYTSLMLTQGGMWFPLDVFMVLVFVKLEFEYRIMPKKKLIY